MKKKNLNRIIILAGILMSANIPEISKASQQVMVAEAN